MKSFKKSLLICLPFSLLIVSGCIDKSYKMIGRECPQVAKYEPPFALIKQYLHSVTLYEGYETRAHFDTLIISDQMSAVYAALHSAKVGHNENERIAFLSQQLEENREYLSMYILADIADESHISLSDKNSSWSIYLTTARGVKMTPISIKEVDLSPEIRSLFGYRYVAFKKSYLVKFAATDIAGTPLIIPGDVSTITFAGAGMAGSVTWQEHTLEKDEATPDQLLKRQDTASLLATLSRLTAERERDEDFYF